MKVFCHYCGQGFKRDEHLARHVLTHTNVRPFQCHACKLTFKRKDLLSRHYRSIHENADQSHGSGSLDMLAKRPAMGRIPIACLSCAGNKTRCDSQTPCSRCRQKGITCERRKNRRTVKSTQIKDKSRLTQAAEVNHSDTPNDNNNLDDINAGTKKATKSSTEEDRCNAFVNASENKSEELSATEETGEPDTVAVIEMDAPPVAYTAMFNGDKAENLFGDIPTQLVGYPPLPAVPFDFDMLDFPMPMDQDFSCASDKNFQDSCCIAPTVLRPPNNTVQSVDILESWRPLQGIDIPLGSDSEGDESDLYATLACLRILENPEVWSFSVSQSGSLDTGSVNPNTPTQNTFSTNTRDWLLSVTQYIWRTVKQEIMYRSASADDTMHLWMDQLILLPPQGILEQLFRHHFLAEVSRFAIFPTSMGGLFTHTQKEDSILHGLLGLLIIAKMTRVSENRDIRAISNGLVGLCHIFNRNHIWASGIQNLEVSLSLVQLLQWSGEAHYMNYAYEMWEVQAQHIQQNLLSHKKFRKDSLNVQPIPCFDSITGGTNLMECQLLYSWMAVDLELSLFYDAPPKLPIQDYPNFRRFSVPSPSSSQSRMSLLELFEVFTDDELPKDADVSHTELHLLLHPLQCVSARLSQCFHTFSGKDASPTFSLASKALTDELEVLLRRWQQLASRSLHGQIANAADSIRASLALYHLIKINSVVSFPVVERLFRDKSQDDIIQNWQAYAKLWSRTVDPKSVGLLTSHCGQCLRYLRALSPLERPLWWNVAIYRITLMLSMLVMSRMSDSVDGSPTRRAQVSVIDLYEDLNDGATGSGGLPWSTNIIQGRAAITKSDGSLMVVDKAVDIVNYCIELIDEHILSKPTLSADVIQHELKTLHSRWKNSCT